VKPPSPKVLSPAEIMAKTAPKKPAAPAAPKPVIEVKPQNDKSSQQQQSLAEAEAEAEQQAK